MEGSTMARRSGEALELARFEELLGRAERLRPSGMKFAELRELGGLYRRQSVQLARLRERADDPDAERYLNALAVRAYTLLYGNRPRRMLSAADMERLAGSLVGAWPALRVSVALLLMGVFLGASLASRDLQAVWTLMPGSMGYTPTMLEELANSEEAQGRFLERSASSVGENALFGSSLFSHNTNVGLLALAAGMLAGIPSVVLQLYNGLIVGAFASIFVGGPWSIDFLAWILPHGIPEFTAISLCAAGGLLLGGAVAAPGKRSRRAALRVAVDSALVLFGVSVVLFLLAALLESFVRESTLGTGERLAIAASMFALLAWGALALGRSARAAGMETSWLSELRQRDA
jgi:uncharacterized membrane protein SpoIIM required for sporulation